MKHTIAIIALGVLLSACSTGVGTNGSNDSGSTLSGARSTLSPPAPPAPI